MTTTTNYGIKKPGASDYYNVEDFNGNADIVDTELKKAEDHRNAANPHSGSEGLLKNAEAKVAPVDADAIPVIDSAASSATKRMTWANVKAAMKNYMDALYAGMTHASRHASGGADALTPGTIGAEAAILSATSKSSLANADTLPLTDSEASSATKKISWTNFKAAIKTYTDTLYAALAHAHAAGDITSGTLAAARGGTGQTSLQATRNAMGLGNTTGALPVANGGTGSATAADARAALGITPANIGAATAAQGATADAALPKAGGTLTGAVTAGGAQAAGTAQVRNIVFSTTDLTPGVSELATGSLYLMYE